MYLALRKCKNDCKILKIILLPEVYLFVEGRGSHVEGRGLRVIYFLLV